MSSVVSPAEIEKMRMLVQEHDANNDEEGDFDPSKVRKPYRFIKFPMMVYEQSRSYPAHDREQSIIRGAVSVMELVHVEAKLTSKLVHTEKELETALAQGWSEQAPVWPQEAISEDGEFSDEPARPKRGRPAKQVG